MFSSVKNFFERTIKTEMSGSAAKNEHGLRLATAALLVEIVMADDKAHEIELISIKQQLKDRFALTDHEVRELVELAQKETTDATDYFQFTSLINKQFSYDEKIKVLEMLWTLVFADGHMDRYEEYTVRKISELLYVNHSDFIAAKLRVRGQ